MVQPGARPSLALKGRDLEAIHGFARRLRAALPGAVREIRFLGFRPLDVPAEAAAPMRPGPTPAMRPEERRRLLTLPPPRPPNELLLALSLERRDVFVEEEIDRIASELSRELGTVVAPFAYTALEWAGHLAETKLAERFERGEVLP